MQTMEGVESVAYETKVILISLASFIRKATSIEEIYEVVQKMANAEGVVIEPYADEDKKEE